MARKRHTCFHLYTGCRQRGTVLLKRVPVYSHFIRTGPGPTLEQQTNCSVKPRIYTHSHVPMCPLLSNSMPMYSLPLFFLPLSLPLPPSPPPALCSTPFTITSLHVLALPSTS